MNNYINIVCWWKSYLHAIDESWYPSSKKPSDTFIYSFPSLIVSRLNVHIPENNEINADFQHIIDMSRCQIKMLLSLTREIFEPGSHSESLNFKQRIWCRRISKSNPHLIRITRMAAPCHSLDRGIYWISQVTAEIWPNLRFLFPKHDVISSEDSGFKYYNHPDNSSRNIWLALIWLVRKSKGELDVD